MKVGFIGLGMMGAGMAKNLLEKGFAVTGMAHRNRAPLERLMGLGATEAADPCGVAEASDVVILCVSGSPQVEACIFGENGILDGARPGLIVIDCSTSLPSSSEKIAAALAEAGCEYLDAPLTRTPIEAEKGTLNAIVGGPEETYAKVEPVLRAFCENIFRVGPVGAGHTLKLINNFMAMSQVTVTAEAFAACRAAGIDAQVLYDLISAGGVNSGLFQLIAGGAVEGDLERMRFSIANALKDMTYFTSFADEAPLKAAVARAIREDFEDAVARGFGEMLTPSMITAQYQTNGLEE